MLRRDQQTTQKKRISQDDERWFHQLLMIKKYQEELTHKCLKIVSWRCATKSMSPFLWTSARDMMFLHKIPQTVGW